LPHLSFCYVKSCIASSPGRFKVAETVPGRPQWQGAKIKHFVSMKQSARHIHADGCAKRILEVLILLS
jgi:hypothetical protein